MQSGQSNQNGHHRGRRCGRKLAPDASAACPMKELNLLASVPKIVRDIASRRANKDTNRRLALKFDVEYFDGPREQGYGGYHYDGRWRAVARKVVEHFRLKPGDRVLDIGCAKGFLLRDLQAELPGLQVFGL